MLKKVQDGNQFNIPVQTWYTDNEQDINEIPESAPAFSTVVILEDSGLRIKMKNTTGEWVEI